MGKQAIHRIDSDFEDDFENDLVLPEGPLSLRLSSKSKDGAATSASRARSMHGHQQQRPHTSHSDTSSISGSSSIIFSTSSSSESNATASESEDQMCDISARLLQQHARTTATTVNSQGSHALDNGQQDTFDEDEDDDDERSNTLKANQLPTDFAEQLALSKAQAALAKGLNPTPNDTTPASQGGTHNSTDWEEDIVFNSSSSLNTSRILSKKASFASHISDSESVHSRSNTSHSQASAYSSINKTSSSSISGRPKSDDDEEDFFEDLELPSYFGSRRDGSTSHITPPSSVESKASSSRKADLQSLLNQKLKARVGLHDTFAIQAAQTASTPPFVRPEPRKKTLSPKNVDKHDERFEDSFIFDDIPPQAVNTRPAASRPSLPSSSSSRSLMNIPSSRSNERISPLPSSSHTLSSRSSSTRSSTTIRPSRSSLNLKEVITKTANTADSVSSNSSNKNVTSWGRAATNATASSLRARPSLSNLSGIAASSTSAATARSSTLHRKQSHNALNESSRAQSTSSFERPSSSMAHYAQPTRASLARHHHQHLPFATISRSDSLSRPGTPLISVFQQHESRVALTSSPSSMAMNQGGVFSRLTRPTIASSAKLHKVTGSDPSGRTSASLGMPITSNPSSPLKSMKVISTSRDGMNQHAAITRALYKQPRRTQTLGDGSELDGIDDLPVNREKEKKFVKIPIRRRQSSGMASVDSIRSNITTATMTGNVRALPVPAPHTSRRERVDSAPEQMQTFNKRPSEPAITSIKSSNKMPSHISVDDAKAGKAAKRPGLKLIRNLSASGLSRVQGQMKWNPVLLKWEGNESSLRDFDNVIASSARPALISPLGPLSPRNVYTKSPLANLPGSGDQQANANSIEQKILSISNPHGTTPSLGGVRIVGDMIFDPVKRSWFSTSSEGEEEINFGDDEEEDDHDDGQNKPRKIDAWEGGEQARLKTRRSFANDWSSNASSTGDDQLESNWSFAEFSRKQREADKRHKEEMKAWKEVEARQSQFMPDIRKYLK